MDTGVPAVTFRRATHADYDHVMNLHDDATDYVTSFYHELLDTSGTVWCVAESAGKMIGFGMVVPLPSAPHSWLRLVSGLHPGHRPQGVPEAITTFLDAQLTKLLSSTNDRTTLSVHLMKEDEIKRLSLLPSQTPLYIGRALTAAIETLTLKKALETKIIPAWIQKRMARTTEHSASEYHTASLCEKLPPYILTRSYLNVDQGKPEGSALSGRKYFITKDDYGNITDGSFFNTFQTAKGTHHHVFFSGEEVITLFAHLFIHYQIVISTLNTTMLSVAVYFPRVIFASDVEDFLVNSLGFSLRPNSGIALITKEMNSYKEKSLCHL